MKELDGTIRYTKDQEGNYKMYGIIIWGYATWGGWQDDDVVAYWGATGIEKSNDEDHI